MVNFLTLALTWYWQGWTILVRYVLFNRIRDAYELQSQEDWAFKGLTKELIMTLTGSGKSWWMETCTRSTSTWCIRNVSILYYLFKFMCMCEEFHLIWFHFISFLLLCIISHSKLCFGCSSFFFILHSSF